MEIEDDGICVQEVESEVIDILSKLQKHSQGDRHEKHHCYRSSSAQSKVYNQRSILRIFHVRIAPH